jgi:D-glycero-alpha-D-manno-heptose-7-phosphate kinase
MIITRTPFRISFFGGGTDFREWYSKNEGCVLSTSIDKYCYISARKLPPFFDHDYRVVYSKIETVKQINDIEHPSVREVLKYLKINYPLEIHYDGDLPARSGIGSSSSFTVGLLKSLFALNGQIISNQALAQIAVDIEQNHIGEIVGSQDQIAASYGGFNKITFHKDGNFSVEPIILKNNRLSKLEDNLLLFFSGFSRISSKIAKKQVDNIKSNDIFLKKMMENVQLAIDILQSKKSLKEFGELLHENWLLKKNLASNISTIEIDSMYNKARDSGAIGGKVLGAGGGGFLLFYVEEENQRKVIQALNHLIHVPFKFENNGSKVVMYEPNGL